MRWLAKGKKVERQEDKETVPTAPEREVSPQPSGPSPTLILDEEELVQWFNTHNCCPDCGETEFLHGPCGGASENRMCATCTSEFNVCLCQGEGGKAFFAFVERISEPKKGRARA